MSRPKLIGLAAGVGIIVGVVTGVIVAVAGLGGAAGAGLAGGVAGGVAAAVATLERYGGPSSNTLACGEVTVQRANTWGTSSSIGVVS